MTKTIYKNRYTGKTAEHLRFEFVSTPIRCIRVHTLLCDGEESKWNDDLLFAIWILASGEKA